MEFLKPLKSAVEGGNQALSYPAGLRRTHPSDSRHDVRVQNDDAEFRRQIQPSPAWLNCLFDFLFGCLVELPGSCDRSHNLALLMVAGWGLIGLIHF